MASRAQPPGAGPRPGPKPGSRNRRGERTREKLLAAALDIVRSDGAAGLSPTELARRVGVHSSLFYTHFKDMDACLAATAEHASQSLTPVTRRLLSEVLRSVLADRALLGAQCRAALDGWLEQRAFVEVLLAHRLEPSALGEVLRGVVAGFRADVLAELWVIASRLQVPPERLATVNQLADLITNQWLWALEAAVTGRIADRHELAELLADAVLSSGIATLRRTLGPTPAERLDTDLPEPRRGELARRRQAFRAAVDSRSDDDWLLSFGGLEPLVDSILHSFQEYLLPSKVSGDAVVVFRVTHAGKAVERAFAVTNRRGTVLNQCGPDAPRVRGTLALRTLLEASSGKRSFGECFRDGELVWQGDVLFTVEFLGWFHLP